MKAQEFLLLVKTMMTAQADYFLARRKSLGVMTTQGLLVKAKELEKQVWDVIKAGKLESDAELDFPADQRPNEAEQKPLFSEEGNE